MMKIEEIKKMLKSRENKRVGTLYVVRNIQKIPGKKRRKNAKNTKFLENKRHVDGDIDMDRRRWNERITVLGEESKRARKSEDRMLSP